MPLGPLELAPMAVRPDEYIMAILGFPSGSSGTRSALRNLALLGIAKRKEEQHQPDERSDAKRRLLCVPSLRLPHQEPFPTDPHKP